MLLPPPNVITSIENKVFNYQKKPMSVFIIKRCNERTNFFSYASERISPFVQIHIQVYKWLIMYILYPHQGPEARFKTEMLTNKKRIYGFL